MADPRYILDHTTYCDLFLDEARRMSQVVKGAAPDVPVPTCPGWTLAKLTKHAGSAHAWAAANTRARSVEGPVPPRSLDLGLPAEPAGLSAWLLEGAERSAATLRETDPETAVWTFGPVKHARFWARRMLFETTVHRVDAQWAVEGVLQGPGSDPAIDPVAAADGVDELLSVLPGRVRRRPEDEQPRGNGETVHLHATDMPDAAHELGEWTITFTPEGLAWERGHAKGDVALRAPAQDLLLIVYGRRSIDAGGAEVFGDRALLERWLETAQL